MRLVPGERAFRDRTTIVPMYSALLSIHSLVRWAILILGILAIVRAARGKASRRPWESADDLVGRLFVGSLDLQMVIGLWMYFFVSPFTMLAMRDFGDAMRTSELRFWAVEHTFGMFIALVLAHVARVRIRKQADPVKKHSVAFVLFLLALLAILISVPWPGMPNGRPLLRLEF